MISGEYSDIIENDILTMQRFLDVSRFLEVWGWQVCRVHREEYEQAVCMREIDVFDPQSWIQQTLRTVLRCERSHTNYKDFLRSKMCHLTVSFYILNISV